MSTKKLQILDNIITTDTSLTQSGFAADAKVVGEALSNLEAELITKQNATMFVNNTDTVLALNDNTEYRLTNISSLTLQYPENNFEVWMNISFSSTGAINVQFPSETKYIGAVPSFHNGETWEISIKDGTVICLRVK